MKCQSGVSPAHYRLIKAVAVVLAVLVAIPGIDAIARIAIPSQVARAANDGLDASSLLGGGDAYEVLGRLEECAAANGADVPGAYVEEIGFLDGAHDVRVGAGGSVIGYVVPGNPSGVLANLTSQMGSRGWTAVPLGELEGATFVKQGGSCTWALATCMQVGSETSVVMRCLCK